MNTADTLLIIYNLLLSSFGKQNWWPAETKIEMIVGAVLTQNTSWSNVEKAIRNLRARDLLSIEGLSNAPLNVLSDYIKPAGYFNLKARRLKNLIHFVNDRYAGNLDELFSLDITTIRDGLLSVNGIGRETADSIVLYAAELPLFVIDTYTYRILTRHGLVDENIDYSGLQAIFMDNLPHEAELFKEFHALIVKAGKEFCKKKPLCIECPLRILDKEIS